MTDKISAAVAFVRVYLTTSGIRKMLHIYNIGQNMFA